MCWFGFEVNVNDLNLRLWNIVYSHQMLGTYWLYILSLLSSIAVFSIRPPFKSNVFFVLTGDHKHFLLIFVTFMLHVFLYLSNILNSQGSCLISGCSQYDARSFKDMQFLCDAETISSMRQSRSNSEMFANVDKKIKVLDKKVWYKVNKSKETIMSFFRFVVILTWWGHRSYSIFSSCTEPLGRVLCYTWESLTQKFKW